MNKKLGQQYWDERYHQQATGWDIGNVSTPLKEYIDQLTNKDLAILIPGCGNAYEARYLLNKGFTNVTVVDISPVLIEAITNSFSDITDNRITMICDDFFNLQAGYDLILEQTFFCALDPGMRSSYVRKMAEILNPGGKLVGILFNRPFEGGPPFGGNVDEYRQLFTSFFEIQTLEFCHNSIEPRAGSEVFIKALVKK